MKCPQCNTHHLSLKEYDSVFCIENEEQANDENIQPQLDNVFHAKLKCFGCGFEKWMTADIKYPTIKMVDKNLNLQEVFKAKLFELNDAWQALNKFMHITTNEEIQKAMCQDFPFKSNFENLSIYMDKWAESASDYLSGNTKATSKGGSIHQSVDYNQLSKINWSDYDEIEIHPCVAIDENNNPLPWENIDISKSMEQVDEDCKDITCWSVYLHLKDGGLECIGDFKMHFEAITFEEFILKHFMKHVSVDVNYTVACTVGQHVDVEAMRININAAIENSDNCMATMKDFDVYHIETVKK